MALKPKKPTLIEEVRRKQVIETAIQAIASRGFAQTTLSDIAKMAGVSTGVITYHFKNKDELLEQCVRTLFEAPNTFVTGRVDMQRSYTEKLRVYIESNVEFMLKNRNHSIAMVQSFGALNAEEEKYRISSRQHTRIRNYLIRIVEGGKKHGEFRDVPSATIAQLVLGALEGIMVQWALSEKHVDLPLYAEQLVDMVTRQVRVDS
jgi:AcrR family transcriptional regulator